MKKVFAILLVLALVVGFAFANETHTLKVKSDVTSVIPVFALRYADNATAITNSTSGPYTSEQISAENSGLDSSDLYQYSNRYGENTAYSYGDNDTAVDVNFNLDEGGSVTVYAVLLNPAKQIETYNLTFGGGVFAAKYQGDDYSVSPKSITTAALANTKGVVAAAGEAAASAETGNKVIGLTFNGYVVEDTLPLKLASAVYAYDPDKKVDLLPEGEFYYADVTLLISAT